MLKKQQSEQVSSIQNSSQLSSASLAPTGILSQQEPILFMVPESVVNYVHNSELSKFYAGSVASQPVAHAHAQPPAQGQLLAHAHAQPPAQGQLFAHAHSQPPAQGQLLSHAHAQPPAQGQLFAHAHAQPPAQGQLFAHAQPMVHALIVAHTHPSAVAQLESGHSKHDKVGRLVAIQNEATSTLNHSVLLMKHFFTTNELKDPSFSLTGLNPKGSNLPPREPLDPIRVWHIKFLVLATVAGNNDEKEKIWHKCKKAMSTKIWEIKETQNN